MIIAKQEQELKEISSAIEISPSPPPSARVNFTVCTINDELALFGGEFFNGQRTEVYGDLFFYNTIKGDWKQIKTKGPTPRSGAQMVAFDEYGGLLWLFGGEYASPSQLQYIHFKDLWVYRLASKQWDKINATGGPSARSGHRMVVDKKKIVVFGGFYDNNQVYHYYNDVHVFSLESYTWLTIDVSGVPPAPRSGCCMVTGQDGNILVWGGFCKSPVKKGVDKGVTHSDMFLLTVEKINETNLRLCWTQAKSTGAKPLSRSGMSVAQGPNGKAYVFGGVLDLAEDEDDLQGHFGNDLHMLDVTTQLWRRIELDKSQKKSKNNYCGESSIQINMQVESTRTRTQMTPSNDVFPKTIERRNPLASSFLKPEFLKAELQNSGFPAPRMNAGLAICNGILYIYGGSYEEGSRQYTLSDFYSINLTKLDSFKVIVANDTTQEWLGSDSDAESDDDSYDNDDFEKDDSSSMDTD